MLVRLQQCCRQVEKLRSYSRYTTGTVEEEKITMLTKHLAA